MSTGGDESEEKTYPQTRSLIWPTAMLVWFSLTGWIDYFESPTRFHHRNAIAYALMSSAAAAILLIEVTNWRGWGGRLSEFGTRNRLIYVQPHSTFSLVLTFLAPLFMVANFVLLVLVRL